MGTIPEQVFVILEPYDPDSSDVASVDQLYEALKQRAYEFGWKLQATVSGYANMRNYIDGVDKVLKDAGLIS